MVNIHYYNSLGANFTTYNPLVRFSKDQIVPTEVDDYFRHQTIQGYVHDMGAAMQGGVGGHAGLFSNANDVAKLMRYLCRKEIMEERCILNRKPWILSINVFTVRKITGGEWDLISRS